MLFSLFVFLCVLSALVLIHEFGHYLAARLMGVKADEFGFGFPPRAIGFVFDKGKWKRVGSRDTKSYANTIWSINWLPLGGFVRMKGEETLSPDGSDSFAHKSLPARFLILVAGVVMNWALAALIFSVGFLVGIPAQLDDVPPSATVRDAHVEIMAVLPGSGADQAGLKAGDWLMSLDGRPVASVPEAQATIASFATTGATLQVGIEREGQSQIFPATANYVEQIKRPALGVELSRTGIVRFPWYQVVPQGVYVTWQYTKLILGALGGLVRDLFVEQKVSADVSGPVGIAVMTGRVAREGVWNLMQFAALLSINLAIMNALPIPALDGGRLLFVILEAVRRKKVTAAFEASLHRVGFLLLLALVALVTINDLRHFGGAIVSGIRRAAGF
jgi:regulator of sigma E protease